MTKEFSPEEIKRLEAILEEKGLLADLRDHWQELQDAKRYKSLEEVLGTMESYGLRRVLEMHFQESPEELQDFLAPLEKTSNKIDPSNIMYMHDNIEYHVALEEEESDIGLREWQVFLNEWTLYLNEVVEALRPHLWARTGYRNYVEGNHYQCDYRDDELLALLDAICVQARETISFIYEQEYDGRGLERYWFPYRCLLDLYAPLLEDEAIGDQLLALLAKYVNGYSGLGRLIASCLGRAKLSKRQGAYLLSWAEEKLAALALEDGIRRSTMAHELVLVIGWSYMVDSFDALLEKAEAYLENHYVRDFLASRASNRQNRTLLEKALKSLEKRLESEYKIKPIPRYAYEVTPEEELALFYYDLGSLCEDLNKVKQAESYYALALTHGSAYAQLVYRSWQDVVSTETLASKRKLLLEAMATRMQRGFMRGRYNTYPAVLDIYECDQDLEGLQSVLNHIENWGYDDSKDMMLAWFELVGRYHSLLNELSPDWLQVHYYSRLTAFIKAKANRSTYALALRLVKSISNRKNGQKIAKEILESWKDDFKKRPQLLGMIEEELKGMA